MPKNILIILGHPARARSSFCEALALAYQQGAQGAGHQVHLLRLAQLAFDPVLHEGYEGEQAPEPDLVAAQDAVRRADHLVVVYPMWEFMMPALLKGFFERAFTPGFAYSMQASNPLKSGLLRGKSARVMQTMGMPAWLYRLWFGAHGAKVIRHMLGFCGIKPVRISYFGLVDPNGEGRLNAYLKQAQALGREGR